MRRGKISRNNSKTVLTFHTGTDDDDAGEIVYKWGSIISAFAADGSWSIFVTRALLQASTPCPSLARERLSSALEPFQWFNYEQLLNYLNKYSDFRENDTRSRIKVLRPIASSVCPYIIHRDPLKNSKLLCVWRA